MDRDFQSQPVSTILSDSFGRFHTYLRVSVTERCNLRCRYCMPEEGVELVPRSHVLTFEEIHTLVSWFAEAGVTKVRITGGEPTVRSGLPDLFAMLNGISGIQTLAITSNGLLLNEMLPRLVANGLKQVNISLDTLNSDLFQEITRRPGLDRVLETIYQATRIKNLETKVNVVAIRGVNDHELSDIVRFFRNENLELRFIEYMPFSGNHWTEATMISKKEIQEQIQAEFPLIPLGYSDGGTGTANRYRLEGYPLVVGFIASMTEHFCGTCSRIRLTADGMFKSCLFENSEIDLKTPLRQGATKEEIFQLVHSKIRQKKAFHGGMNLIAANPGRSMIAIGG